MKIFEANQFNEDMELIQKYSELIRNILIKMTVHKEFYDNELRECKYIINCIMGYSQIIRKNDLESARNYLRTCSANKMAFELLNNMSEELQEILNEDKFWNESINKTKFMINNKDEQLSEILGKKVKIDTPKGNTIKRTMKKNIFKRSK
ncbi:nitrogen regulatory protein PII [Clostridium beijerinckii]|nr:nitrogen regulatory protein PII [Clostridium beijerinckii]